jgi:hypothetical protein
MKALLSLLIALGIASVVSAQQTTTVITVNDPRPLSETILKLEKVSNQPMTYEDAPVVYAGDLVDMSDVYRHKPGVKVLMPKFVTLSVTFTTSEIADRAGTAQVLQRLVTKFNRENPKGPQFTILDKDGLFHVIPKSQRLASGKVVPYTSPLDVPLTVVVKDVLAGVALKAVLDAIEAKTRTKILVGISPFDTGLNVKGRRTFSISTQTQTGRTLVTQLMQGFSPWWSWELLTGANVTGAPSSFFISIQQWVRKQQ